MIIEKLKIIYSLVLVSALTFTISCSDEGDPDIELTEAPEVAAATAVTGTSFTANWQAVTGAKFYVLEVSENVEFTVPLLGYAAKQVTGTSHDVTGLNADKKYFYRVRAGNSLGETANSRIAPVRPINKTLLYNTLWLGDEVKSDVGSLILMDLYFNSNGNYTAYFFGSVLTTGTWQWQGDTNVMNIQSGTGNFSFTWVDVGDTYCRAYASAITENLIFYDE